MMPLANMPVVRDSDRVRVRVRVRVGVGVRVWQICLAFSNSILTGAPESLSLRVARVAV